MMQNSNMIMILRGKNFYGHFWPLPYLNPYRNLVKWHFLFCYYLGQYSNASSFFFKFDLPKYKSNFSNQWFTVKVLGSCKIVHQIWYIFSHFAYSSLVPRPLKIFEIFNVRFFVLLDLSLGLHDRKTG